MSYFRPSKTKKRSLTRSKSRCDISTDSFSSTDSMASDFMGLKGGTDNSLDSVFNNGWSSSGNSSRLSEKLSVSLPKYIEGAIEVGKFINHAVIAVLTGNIAFLVEDIVIYAVAAKHCKAECKRLSKQFEIARDSAKELLNKLAENPKEIEDKSFGSALKAFAIVLEDGRAVVKQHAEAKYGLKVFHARKFAAEFQDIEERLDQACNRLNFAINIRHFVNSQELEETHKTWHEEDKKAFAEINTMVKETLEEVRGFKDSKNAPSLLGTRISSTELSNVEHFKTDRLFTATYHTINEYSRKLLDLKVVIKVTLARESVPFEVSKFALEVAYLQKLAPSPNIIDLIGITSRRGHMSLVLDYCENEDLQSFIASGNLKGDWGKKRSIALGIAQGMAFLHKAGILHKYINSANILLDKYYRAKITNFRKSRWSNGESYRSIDSFEEQIRWTAPERLGDDVAPFKEECDIYSFGIVFYEIVSERFPWQGHQLDRVYNLKRFERKELELPPNIPTTISSIFAKCTCLAPRRRFKTTEIIDHLEVIRPECLENTLFAQDEDTEDGLESVKDEKDDENKYLTVRSTRYLEIPSDISEEEESGPTREEIIEKANNYHQLRDYRRAREEYEEVADDYPHALFRLGEYYYYGKGVQKDIPKSIEYFEKAVEGGDGDAMDMIGYLYLTGNGLPKDRFKAVKYFKQAVDLNIPHGIYHLGVCHSKGIGGLKKDVEESKRLVLKAASMGNVEAKKYAHQQEWDKPSSR